MNEYSWHTSDSVIIKIIVDFIELIVCWIQVFLITDI